MKYKNDPEIWLEGFLNFIGFAIIGGFVWNKSFHFEIFDSYQAFRLPLSVGLTVVIYYTAIILIYRVYPKVHSAIKNYFTKK